MLVAEDWTKEEAEVRLSLFDQLDRLAFALEMEAAEYLEEEDEEQADRYQRVRLGVRLAQRLVSGVWSDEVHPRLHRWHEEYDSRTRGKA